MNAYDWDKTIFAKDTTAAFFLYCCERFPAVRPYLKGSLSIGIRHLQGKTPLPEQKQHFYRYLSQVPHIEQVVKDFWEKHAHLIGEPAMPCNPQPGDVVISASAEFLLRDICAERGLILIGSRIDPFTGEQTGIDCYGEEKVRRFRETFGDDACLEEWYSDSTSDAPMAALAKEAYLVSKQGLKPWPKA